MNDSELNRKHREQERRADVVWDAVHARRHVRHWRVGNLPEPELVNQLLVP